MANARKQSLHTKQVTAFFFFLSLVHGNALPAGDQLRVYNDQLKPLLAVRCFSCHGSLKQEAGLRLDTVEFMLKGGDSGHGIVKGDPDASLLLARVSEPNPALRMPPEDEGDPLTVHQLGMLRAWITANSPTDPNEKPEADPRDHWAFVPRVRPTVPSVAVKSDWLKNPIDAFISYVHEKNNLVPQPQADRAILVRRLFIDLVGLPPSAEELAAIDSDTSPDWYAATVDRLLADPRHGERWARHWMDVWRYSDWWGLDEEHRNSQKHLWHWRDWIVESLNRDTPYDEMVRQMLAADELYPDDPSKLRATGYLARHWFSWNRTQWLDETVEHVGKGLLGLTMNCSKCHDHKYDPIQQVDYYRMRAFFEPYHVRLDVVPNDMDLKRDGIPRVFDGVLEAPTYLFVRGEENKPDKSHSIEPGVPAIIAFKDLTIAPVVLPTVAYYPERQPWIIDAQLDAASRAVELAQAALTKIVHSLVAAQQTLQRLAVDPQQAIEPATESTVVPHHHAQAIAQTAVDSLELEVGVYQRAVDIALAEKHSIERRAAATRLGWEVSDAVAPVSETVQERMKQTAQSAVQAERELAVAHAQHNLAKLRLQLLRTPADKKEVEKAIDSVRNELEKARSAVAEPGELFTPLKLIGAKWSTTRFRTTTADDPPLAFPATSTGRRRALATWITDPRNPLTARVAANQIWMRHMGRPLVSTVFDFGRKGNAPSHPELLDWLASELVDQGWSMKHLHRLIVTSAAYQMTSSSFGAESNMGLDPDNRLLWRRDAMRLESQVIRDAILAFSGTLDLTFGGPSVPPTAQADSKRRSLYFFHSNNDRNPFLKMFDDADVKECYQREQSIVPQQALALSNSRLVHDAAAQITKRLHAAGQSIGGDAGFIAQAFILLLNRSPTKDELADCMQAIEGWQKLSSGETLIDANHRAHTHLVWALINHNDFITLR